MCCARPPNHRRPKRVLSVAQRVQIAVALEGLGQGHMEQHPRDWLDAVVATCGEVLQQVDGAQIAGVGVSGQQHGCVVLDDQDEVVRPAKLWCDTATAVEAQELAERLGRPVPTGFTASKLAWIKQHEPHNWARIRRVLLPHDYVNFRFTKAPLTPHLTPHLRIAASRPALTLAGD